MVLFFVIGFCSESVDIKDEMRFENILRFLMRLGIAEWLVANNVTIMKAIFGSIGGLIGLLSEKQYVSVALSPEDRSSIQGLNFGQGFVMLLITLVIFLVMIVCGFYMIYTVFFRFLKILVVVPFGSLASATIAGNRTVSHTAVTYFKHFLSLVLEAVVIAIAIIASNALLSSGILIVHGRGTGWTGTLLYLLEMCFTAALTVGSVKGAQTLTQKMLGLGG